MKSRRTAKTISSQSTRNGTVSILRTRVATYALYNSPGSTRPEFALGYVLRVALGLSRAEAERMSRDGLREFAREEGSQATSSLPTLNG